MNHCFEGFEAGGLSDEIGGQVFVANLNEVGGVGAVVAADDEKQIHRLIKHVEKGVLPFLGGATDGVEHLEILIATIPVDDCMPNASLNLFSFAFKHRSLIGHPDFLKMHVRIKSV